MNNSVENFLYTSFNSVGYLFFKAFCWSSWNLVKVCILLTKINLASSKGRNLFWAMFKSKINVTNDLLLLFTILTWSRQKSIYAGDCSCRSWSRYIENVLLFSFRERFSWFWATILEILPLELQVYFEIFAESALCLILYLVSNCHNSRTKREK